MDNYNECFWQKLSHYSRLLLRLLGIRRTAKQTNSCNMIQYCKGNLSWHGIPDVLLTMLNNSIAKSLSNLQKMVECSLSGLYHNQSNRKVESAVKIAKKLIKKTELVGCNLWKAILDWGNTSIKQVAIQHNTWCLGE